MDKSKVSFSTGFAHITNNQTSPSQTIESCVCKCLLNGCTALTFYNSSGICSLVYDTMITESDVTFNSTAMLLIVKATLADAP